MSSTLLGLVYLLEGVACKLLQLVVCLDDNLWWIGFNALFAKQTFFSCPLGAFYFPLKVDGTMINTKLGLADATGIQCAGNGE